MSQNGTERPFHIDTMQKTKMILLAVSRFIAGFLSCYWLIPQPQPTSAAIAPAPTPFAMLTPPMVSTQVIEIDDGVWYQHSDGVLRRTPPATLEPQRRPVYYDLIDTRDQPNVDLSDLK